MFTAAAITAMAMTGLGAIGSGMVQQPANGPVAEANLLVAGVTDKRDDPCEKDGELSLR